MHQGITTAVLPSVTSNIATILGQRDLKKGGLNQLLLESFRTSLRASYKLAVRRTTLSGTWLESSKLSTNTLGQQARSAQRTNWFSFVLATIRHRPHAQSIGLRMRHDHALAAQGNWWANQFVIRLIHKRCLFPHTATFQAEPVQNQTQSSPNRQLDMMRNHMSRRGGNCQLTAN